MPSLNLPPFPDDIPIHPLLIVDYQLILAGDHTEIKRLWGAGTKIGFWYLKNHGVDEEVDAMFDLGAETLDLPLDEKMRFEQGDSGLSFGYKATGANVMDATGQRDTHELINIAKDDALAWPRVARRTYPAPVHHAMARVVAPFVQKSIAVTSTLINVLNNQLGLPSGTLARMHPVDARSGSEVRCIRAFPAPPSSCGGDAGVKLSNGAHTDFGSLSFLHNRLGGLQVLVPGAEAWQYVRPIPGHAVCNIGDSLKILSGGILRSNLHRVAPPPGAQAHLERFSLVYFARPADSMPLRALADQSLLIAHAPDAGLDTGVTAGDWHQRRVKNRRFNNQKGAETWKAGMGTEDLVES
ncbi:hypothetical protein BD779DRAFT_1671529 [Infundibulicybe gibba]|nr:hypothetical protein BD779DRAFT_1671529 [Infundibulicybe gibba]